MAANASIHFLGTRGTVPVEGSAFSQYGGKTACVLIRLGGEVVVFDGGTGLMDLADALLPDEHCVHLLLSHPHADHLMGIPACPVLFQENRTVRVYGASHHGLGVRAQLETLMSPPLWPVTPDVFSARVSYHEATEAFSIGSVRVRTLPGAHPGGCTAYRLDCGGTSIVYASDYELDAATAPALEAFSQNCTLLLCDGQYTEAEFAQRTGYGHSAWPAAAQLAGACSAAALRVLHHAPWRTDRELAALEPQLRSRFAGGAFARCGEVVAL